MHQSYCSLLLQVHCSGSAIFGLLQNMTTIGIRTISPLPFVEEPIPKHKILKCGPWTIPSTPMYFLMMGILHVPMMAFFSLVIGDLNMFGKILSHPIKICKILGVMYLPALHGNRALTRTERMKLMAKTIRNAWDLDVEFCYRVPAFLNYMRRMDTKVSVRDAIVSSCFRPLNMFRAAPATTTNLILSPT